MPAYLKKTKTEILTEALQKLQRDTTITAIGPGSVARALTEAVTTQLGDMYDILDFNVNQTLMSTATGSALDLMGDLYNVKRKQITDLAIIDKKLGGFMFYLATPHSSDIVIPRGTNVYTDATTFMGQRFSFSTTDVTIIAAGRTRAYASIQPNFIDTVYVAGVDTLLIHDFPSPPEATVFCTNPKSIAPQAAYETDDQYRVRLIKGLRVAAGGTLEAVRFAGLGVTGVRDVKIRQAPYGMGSFEAIVVPERGGSINDAIGRADEAMSVVRPVGVKMYVKSPNYLSLDITIGLIAPNAQFSESREALVKRGTVAVSRYLNSLLPGSELMYNQMIQMIMDSSELVKDVIISRFAINGAEVLRRNYKPNDDEQIVFGDIIVDIARS